VNAVRSAEVKAMLDLLRELDNGTGGDFGGFDEFGFKYERAMKGRINSYRAQKIAVFLDKNISKSHLVQFSKDKHVLIEKDKLEVFNKSGEYIAISNITIKEFIDINKEALLKYWRYSRVFYINNALRELDNDTN
jgi:hypothetical protein